MDVVAEGLRFDSDAVELSQLAARVCARLRLRRADDGRARPRPHPARAKASIGATWCRRRHQIAPKAATRAQQQQASWRIDADLLPAPLVLAADVSTESNSRSGAQCSQPLPWISVSSWPGAQPAWQAREWHSPDHRRPRNRLENVQALRCGQANAVVDRQRRILDEKVGAMRHKAPSSPAGPPRMTFTTPAGARRRPDASTAGMTSRFHQQIRKVDRLDD